MKNKRFFNRTILDFERGFFVQNLMLIHKTNYSLVECFGDGEKDLILTFEKILPDGRKKGVQVSKLFYGGETSHYKYTFNFYLKEL